MQRHIESQDIVTPLAALRHNPAACGISAPAQVNTSFTGAAAEISMPASWFDTNGHECDPEDAEFVVFGPCPQGNWHTVELGRREDTQMQ